jgi:hypothetical protein
MKYKYKVKSIQTQGLIGSEHSETVLKRRLKKLGDKGWELVHIIDNNLKYSKFYFKKTKFN